MENKLTIHDAVQAYLECVALSRSENTARTYQNSLKSFTLALLDANSDPRKTSIDELTEDAVAWFVTYLKDLSPTTKRLYLTAAKGLYEFLAAERFIEPNLPRVRLLIRQRSRRVGQRLPQFPRDHIKQVLEHAINLTARPREI